MVEESLLQKYPNLKKQAKTGKIFGSDFEGSWTNDNILEGFKKFFDENGRYPTAEEIDQYEFLPSSRQIQRAFGGLRNLRKKLGLEIADYGRGVNRSKIAFEANKRGGIGEKETEEVLINHFGEYFVHVEKPLYKYIKSESELRKDSKCRVDFLVYAKNYTFCVDVFFTNTLRTFISNINAKSKKYTNLLIDVYLVNLNENGNITESAINLYLKRKSNKLDSNVKVLNKSAFYGIIKNIPAIEVLST